MSTVFSGHTFVLQKAGPKDIDMRHWLFFLFHFQRLRLISNCVNKNVLQTRREIEHWKEISWSYADNQEEATTLSHTIDFTVGSWIQQPHGKLHVVHIEIIYLHLYNVFSLLCKDSLCFFDPVILKCLVFRSSS